MSAQPFLVIKTHDVTSGEPHQNHRHSGDPNYAGEVEQMNAQQAT